MAAKACRGVYDVVICGGGTVGSSVAYHLAARGARRVLVVERDMSYRKASFGLSAGGVRQQFSLAENVQMSMYGIDFMKSMGTELSVDSNAPDIQFKENGYLFLASPQGVGVLHANNKTQHDCGATWIDILQPNDLQTAFPWLSLGNDEGDSIALGSFSQRNEGYFDPWAFVQGMKQKSISCGVEYVEGSVVGASVDGSNVVTELVVDMGSEQCSVGLSSGAHVVNAAGAWAGGLVDMFRQSAQEPAAIAPLPVAAKKRCVFSVSCTEGYEGAPVPPENTPLVVLPSGVYFRPEGGAGNFLCGVSPPAEDDPDCVDADLDEVSHHLFDELIWPSLFEFVPAFGNLKQTASWAGFYDHNTLDQNAIIGFHPQLKNLVLCNGFSGHGLQQAPAAGRAVSELIDQGEFTTIDLERFSFDRVSRGEPLFETGIV